MKITNKKRLEKLIEIANHKIQGIDLVAQIDEQRAYGGIIRATKGKLLEEFCKDIVRIAWDELGGKADEIDFSNTRINIPLNKTYIKTIKSEEIRKWIRANYKDFIFPAQVDVHVMIKGDFVLGIECKSYTENAMLKRILVDFTLLKTKYTKLKCGLLQLESQLTGDYSEIDKKIIYGSHSSHTLMSYFDVNLNIMTLVQGERKVDEPIHKPEFFKPITYAHTVRVIDRIKELLQEYK